MFKSLDHIEIEEIIVFDDIAILCLTLLRVAPIFWRSLATTPIDEERHWKWYWWNKKNGLFTLKAFDSTMSTCIS